MPRRYWLALHWVSRSITKVFNPLAALMAARFTVMLDFPTPPFWLNTTRVMHISLLVVMAESASFIRQLGCAWSQTLQQMWGEYPQWRQSLLSLPPCAWQQQIPG